MNIGIIGSGEVARTLAAGLAGHGHAVMLGTRDETKLASFVEEHEQISVGSVASTATFGELTILAVKGSVALDVVRGAADELAGKTVIDTTNPITDTAPEDGVLNYFTDVNDSLLEMLQREYPAIHFIKAFNSVGAGNMIDPDLPGGPPTMFIAGNQANAKLAVSSLLEQVGWDVYDMGGAAAARAIEPLCRLWCIPGFINGEWGHAFKLLR